MQDFIDTANQQIWSFEDDVLVVFEEGVYSFFTPAGASIVNAPTTLVPYVPPVISPEEAVENERKRLWKIRQQDALIALVATDTVAIRCFKASVPYPQDWNAYTWELRSIVSSEDGDPDQPFPIKPDYPPST